MDLTGNFKVRTSPHCIDASCWETLTEPVKAEVALVVALFSHINRVVSAIVGGEMSVATMKVPRAAAKIMESRSAVSLFSFLLSPMMANTFQASPEKGFTNHIFDDKHAEGAKPVKLPKGLQNLFKAGKERAEAVARLLRWMAYYESDLVLDGSLFDYDLIKWMDLMTRTAQEEIQVMDSLDNTTCQLQRTPKQVLEWVEARVDKELVHESKGTRAMVTVHILITLAPKAIYQSHPWKELVAYLGEAQARSITVFWSLRTTLQEAQILFSSVGGEDTVEEPPAPQRSCEC